MSDGQTGIGSIGTVNAQTVIGVLNGSLPGEKPPLATLAEHIPAENKELRDEFVRLKEELMKAKPEKSTVTEIVDKLEPVIGGVASCAKAIGAILATVAAFGV